MYCIVYDGEWVEDYETLEEVKKYFDECISDFEETKKLYPALHGKNEVFEYYGYSVLRTVAHEDGIKDLLKNKS